MNCKKCADPDKPGLIIGGIAVLHSVVNINCITMQNFAVIVGKMRVNFVGFSKVRPATIAD